MDHDQIMKAMIRKYTLESSSRFMLTDNERVDHIFAEFKNLLAQKYGFNNYHEMDSFFAEKDTKWQSLVSKQAGARGK